MLSDRSKLLSTSLDSSSVLMQSDDTRVEVCDNWYNPSAAQVYSDGGRQETRSDRLVQWATQSTEAVTKVRNELRATRMQAFEKEEEAREATQALQKTREDLKVKAKVRKAAPAMPLGWGLSPRHQCSRARVPWH